MTLHAVAATLAGAAPAMANHLWQSTAFAAIAACLALALRKNRARARYWVWMSASMKLLLPFALLAGVASHWEKPRVAVSANAPMYVAVEVASEPFAQSLAVAQTRVPEARYGVPGFAADIVPLVCAGAWFAGFVTILVAWGVRWRRVAKAMRAAAPLHEGREVEALRRIEASAGVRRPIALRVSAAAMEPGVFGILRPVLAWPERISERLDDAQLEAVLAHEVCHVRRRDNLAAALHMLVEAAFWFHPMAWWVGARLVAERERACDEEVVERCGRPTAYAESILKVCEFCVQSPLECVSGVTGADLKQRVVEIMSAHVVRKLTLGKKVLIGAVALCTLAVPVLLAQAQAARRLEAMMLTPPQKFVPAFLKAPAAQAESAADAAAPAAQDAAPPVNDAAAGPAFEVASIRPTIPGPVLMRWQPSADGLIAQTLTLKTLIAYAYDIIQPEYVLGGPDWTSSQPFDINAKFGDEEMQNLASLSALKREERMKAMLRTLLAERFKLKLRQETKDVPIYALVVTKSGSKLAESPPLVADQDGVVPPDGSSFTTMFNGRHIMKRTNMRDFVAQLGRDPEIAREVVDETGLTGRYNFEYKWKATQDGSGPSLFTVLEDQLGLKLVPRKGPVEMLVIVSAEKPSVDGAEVSDPAAAKVLPVALVQEKAAQQPNAAAASEADAASVLAPGFEVSTVKPGNPNTRSSSLNLGMDEIRSFNLPLTFLLQFAYNLNGGSTDQIVDAPSWVSSVPFDITAKMDEKTAASLGKLPYDERTAALRLMMRALLAERFQLKLHHETREMPVLALEVAKGGPKLTRASGSPVVDSSKQPGPDDWTGLHNPRRGVTEGRDVPIKLLVDALSSKPEIGGRLVLDRTGLQGNYNFMLQWTPEDGRTAAEGSDQIGPSLSTALQEQLGLKLESRKAPVDVLVIDHVERPSEN